MHDPRESLRGVRPSRGSREGGRNLDRNGYRRYVSPEVFGRAGQGNSAAAPLLQPFLEFLRKAPVSRQIPAEIDGLAPPRRCAGDVILAWSRRFKAALLGRAGLLFMRPPLPRR